MLSGFTNNAETVNIPGNTVSRCKLSCLIFCSSFLVVSTIPDGTFPPSYAHTYLRSIKSLLNAYLPWRAWWCGGCCRCRRRCALCTCSRRGRAPARWRSGARCRRWRRRSGWRSGWPCQTCTTGSRGEGCRRPVSGNWVRSEWHNSLVLGVHEFMFNTFWVKHLRWFISESESY